MSSNGSNTCSICGAPLRIWRTQESKTCVICGRKHTDIIWCPNGHYICERCSANPSVELIRQICTRSESKNPVDIALTIMNSPVIQDHDSAHHILASAALLTAYKNCGGKIDLKNTLEEAIKRGTIIPSALCTLAGICGGVMSAGVFYSIIAETDPLSVTEWGKGNVLVSECLQKSCAIGGSRCCTRGILTSIRVGAQYSAECFGISLEMPEKIQCSDSEKIKDCNKTVCPYYTGNTIRGHIYG